MEKYSSDLLLDDKMAKNIVGDLRKHMPPGGFPKHKPVVTGGQPVKSRIASGINSKRGLSLQSSNDSDLVSKMA